MIETIEGKGVGAGKSYYVTTRVIKQIADGGTVFHSSKYQPVWEEIAKLVEARYGVIPERDQLQEFPQDDVWKLHEITPPGTEDKPVLIIIDEAHTAINARDWADKSKRPFFDWLTQSRHDNNDLIFISQSAHNIDKQVARLVTYVVRARNMMTFPILGITSKRFCIGRFDQDGRTLIGSKQYIRMDKQVFKCYRSKSCGGSHKRLMAGIPPKRLKRVRKKHPMIKYFFLLVLGFGIWGGYGLWNKNQQRKAKIAARESSQPPAIGEGPATTTAKPQKSTVVFVAVEFGYYSDRRKTFHTGPATLRTDRGIFIEGEASEFGMCDAIRSEDLSKPYAVARCVNGEQITMVVANRRGERQQPSAEDNAPRLDTVAAVR